MALTDAAGQVLGKRSPRRKSLRERALRPSSKVGLRIPTGIVGDAGDWHPLVA